MGSFANSLHVKSDNALGVAEAVRHAMIAEGYEATDDEPDKEGPGPSLLRAVHVSEAREGWVSLLDSDGIHSMTLAATLSARLQTHAIQFLVNDSDSWHYQLFHAGRQIDEFASRDDEDQEEDGESPELAGIFAGTNAAEIQRVILERARQVQQQLQQRMPPELRQLQEKWRKTGEVTPEEMRQYQEWARAETPNLRDMLGNLREMLGATTRGPNSRGERPRASDELRAHADYLKPLLKDGVGEERVLDMLGKQAVFAEETLGEFLPLLGLSSYYAYLGYQYLEECSTADLTRESIRLTEHLKFKKSSGQGAGQLRLVH